MPDFSARIGLGAVAAPWDDHEGSGTSRINPLDRHASMFLKATVGTEVEVRAIVGFVEGPADSALGGRLFTADFGEWPYGLPHITSPASHTSIQRFTPNAVGHYLFWIRRAGGGSIGFHIDAEAPLEI